MQTASTLYTDDAVCDIGDITEVESVRVENGARRSPHSEALTLATVRERITFFNNKEIRSAQLARDFKARMVFPTDDRMIRMLQSGTNYPFTDKDVRNATFIWGKSTSESRGKEVHRKRLTGPPIARPLPVVQDIDINGHIFRVNRYH